MRKTLLVVIATQSGGYIPAKRSKPPPPQSPADEPSHLDCLSEERHRSLDSTPQRTTSSLAMYLIAVRIILPRPQEREENLRVPSKNASASVETPLPTGANPGGCKIRVQGCGKGTRTPDSLCALLTIAYPTRRLAFLRTARRTHE